MNFPGRNHDYIIDCVFYTLQSQSGEYLSNPNLYAKGVHTQKVLIPFSVPPSIETAVSLTKRWSCAWVTYSIEDLREIYVTIKDQFTKIVREKRPKFPCIGRMIYDQNGMITVKGLRQLTLEEQQDLKASVAKEQAEEKAVLPGQQPGLIIDKNVSQETLDFQQAFLAAYSGEEGYTDNLPGHIKT